MGIIRVRALIPAPVGRVWESGHRRRRVHRSALGGQDAQPEGAVRDKLLNEQTGGTQHQTPAGRAGLNLCRVPLGRTGKPAHGALSSGGWNAGCSTPCSVCWCRGRSTREVKARSA
jgi:hypothetical protein